MTIAVEVTPPPEEALLWAANAFGPHAKVTSTRRLSGGITSAMHLLSIVDRSGTHRRAVMRRWLGPHPSEPSELIRAEAGILAQLESTDIAAPRLLAADSDATSSDVPSLLMSYLSGHVELSPSDPIDWLGQMAEMLARIHRTDIAAPPGESWLQRENLVVPEWTSRPGLWRDAFALMEEDAPMDDLSFIHHDYQEFNLLWRRGVLVGVVDWVFGSNGPPDMDVSHCRLNLAVLYSPNYAATFLDAYESVSGRYVDPWWDVEGLLKYLPGWGDFLQVQAGKRKKVDFAGMNERVEATLEAALHRA